MTIYSNEALLKRFTRSLSQVEFEALAQWLDTKASMIYAAGHQDRIDKPIAFAGMWTTFNGDRGTKSKPVPGPHQVYGFLTTSPNAVVEPIHPKAMPVILTTDEERDVWDARAVG